MIPFSGTVGIMTRGIVGDGVDTHPTCQCTGTMVIIAPGIVMDGVITTLGTVGDGVIRIMAMLDTTVTTGGTRLTAITAGEVDTITTVIPGTAIIRETTTM
ncbi:MAG: hypothetical protein CSA36_02015 [Draconibacterium sp.]|nr:MAG: hypothetical protein CSA36_02015 [Draconibacterium sp.]